MTLASHTIPQLTDKQRANLAKLAAYLRGPLKARFDMSFLYWGHDECGSVGCAVGHGPLAGIERREREQWVKYACRAFRADGADFMVWHWCFDGFWWTFDNTPDGAADRIDYMLANGIPDDFEEPRKQWVSVYSGATP
jgi:hypothetical protein